LKRTKPFAMKFALIAIVCFIMIHVNVKAQYRYNKIVWQDEFNFEGSMPDTTKWSYDNGNGCPNLCGWGNNELQYYTTARQENAHLKGGNLIIEARRESFDVYNYTSARMVTKNKGDWKYGRVEVRAKIPTGRGIWPAVWMLPTKWEYGSWPHSGEIDIMENVGYWPDSLFGTVHTGAYNGMINTQRSQSINIKELHNNFHVYAMEWTEEEISFWVDDKRYHTFKNEHKNSETWPFDKEFHLVMNVAVGGNWGGKYGVDDAIFPQRMEVDYVRVYQ